MEYSGKKVYNSTNFIRQEKTRHLLYKYSNTKSKVEED